MLCMNCKYDHECPYMTDQDMVHALMDGGEEVYKLMDKVRELLGQLKARIKEDFKMSKDFGFDIELAGCRGYESEGHEEGFKVGWDDESLEGLRSLILELYRLNSECRSKVGVRVPFETYDVLMAVLEKCVCTARSCGVVSEN
jgi:hypothetical protein